MIERFHQMDYFDEGFVGHENNSEQNNILHEMSLIEKYTRLEPSVVVKCVNSLRKSTL